MPMIESYEEAVDYVYGRGTTHWTITPRNSGGPYWYFIYTDVYGNPIPIVSVEGDDWYANLEDLNMAVSHLKPEVAEVSPPLSPVIRKIKALEARFKERASV